MVQRCSFPGDMHCNMQYLLLPAVVILDLMLAYDEQRFLG